VNLKQLSRVAQAKARPRLMNVCFMQMNKVKQTVRQRQNSIKNPENHTRNSCSRQHALAAL
jgi:hypothetical protein